MTERSEMSGARPRVAMDMTFPDRNQGGSGRYARSLLDALTRRDDIQVRAIRSGRPGVARTIRWLRAGADREIRNSQADLLHSPSFVAPWTVSVPFVVTIFDLSTRMFPADHPLEWRVYERWFLAARARAASRVIAISEATRRDAIVAYRVDPRRVVTIHPGVDDRFFQPVSVSKPVSRPEPLLLFPGAPVARKNLNLVLEAMGRASAGSRLSRACLEISGASKEAFAQSAQHAAELGLTDRVTWLGHVSADAMPAVMREADVCVYPSFYEGFGFPPLEAMASGTPVVAANTSCLPEILGDAALLVDPTDVTGFSQAVEAALGNADLRARLVRAGRERAARFTWDRCAAETVGVYRQALEAA